MKNISVPLQAHLAQPYQTMAVLWLCTRQDDQVFGFTNIDQPITLDVATYPIGGGVTFLPMAGEGSDIVLASDMQVDTMEVAGVLQSPMITEDDLRAGKWDACAINIFMVNWADLTMGPIYEFAGSLGKCIVDRGVFKAELWSLLQAYTKIVGELTSPTCRARLGDGRCKVPMNPPVWQPGTAYAIQTFGDASVGSTVSPSTFNGCIFRCAQAGTSGGGEPTWVTTIGGATIDGGAIWVAIRARTVTGTLTGVLADNQTVFDTARTEPGPAGGIVVTNVSNANPGIVTLATPLQNPFDRMPIVISGVLGMANINSVTLAYNPAADGLSFSLGVDTSDVHFYSPYTGGGLVTPFGNTSGFFDGGKMTFTSGLNIGLSMEVKGYVPGQWVLQQPMPYPIGADTYVMTQGCDKLKPTCKLVFFNIYNARAEYDLGGNDQLSQIGTK